MFTQQPLSTAVLSAVPTVLPTQNRRQGFSEEDKLHVSAIVVLPSQRESGLGSVDGEEVEDWTIGIATIRCGGVNPST